LKIILSGPDIHSYKKLSSTVLVIITNDNEICSIHDNTQMVVT